MTDQHPITPPPQLIAHWMSILYGYTEAARWGADQELEACCEWLDNEIGAVDPCDLRAARRAARRPLPKSLSEEALAELKATERCYPADFTATRRALERLQELEGQGDD